MLPLILLLGCTSATVIKDQMENKTGPKTIHEFKVPAIDGGTIDFSTFKGKKILATIFLALLLISLLVLPSILVTQSLYEEINVVTKGGNYGWNVKEGTHCFSTDNDLTTRPSCPTIDSAGNPFIDPVIQLKNKANPDGTGSALVVIGGNVYRGSAFPQLKGRYIFGNYSQSSTAATGELYVATVAGSGQWAFEDLALKDYPNSLGYFLKGFGQDASGELYIAVSGVQGVSGTTGKVFKLVPAQ